MPDIVFRYEPALLSIMKMHGDAVAAFDDLYPDHARWLRDNAVEHCVSAYCWPDLLARIMYNQIGTIVCEFEVTVAGEFAEQFAAIKDASAPSYAPP